MSMDSRNGICRVLQFGPSELEPGLKRDHSWRAVSAEPDAKQTCWRRRRICQPAEPSLGGGSAGDSGVNDGWQRKISVIEQIETLNVQPQFDFLGQRERFGQIEIAPNKVRAAKRVPAKISELTVARAVTADAGAGAWING